MSAELKARVERLEEDARETRKEIEALKRFKIAATTLYAATLGMIGFFSEKIKKALGL